MAGLESEGRLAEWGENKSVKTLRLVVDAAHLNTAEAQEALERGAQILRAGGLVALPTETVYGLGADALDAAAVGRIFEAKRRPAWDPVIVHVSDAAMLEGLVVEVPETAWRLMEAFWPGPLTLLLKRTAAVPDAVTAGRPLVGVRMPAHPVALELIRRAGIPVAAPSANLFGHTSPTTAQHVLDDLDGRIDAVLDAGATGLGVESTVLDVCQPPHGRGPVRGDPGESPMMIYRPGAVTAEQIRAIAGPVEIFRSGALGDKPREAMPSPGVGVRHYAPSARLVLVEGELGELSARMPEAAAQCDGERVGVMLPAEIAPPAGTRVFAWGRWDELEVLARELYAGLRALDAQGCTVIICPVPRGEGMGAAIRDRLRKAAYR
jgi:L-threonylcarbamoyladenylate synthase